MTYRHIIRGAGALLSLGLLAGCAGGDDGEGDTKTDGSPKASASAEPKGPAYDGPGLPGLAKTPAWSLADEKRRLHCAGDPAKKAASQVVGASYDPQTCVLGDAVVLTRDLTEHGQTDDGSEKDLHFQALLLDAATGDERRTIDIEIPAGWTGARDPKPSAFVQVTQAADGSPALLVVDGDQIEADGLKKASVTTSYTLYAPSGKELGASSYTGDDHTDLTVEAGHVLLKEEYRADTYAPIGGGDTVEVENRGHGQGPIGAGFGLRVAGTYSVVDGSGSRLAVSDRRTGEELWTIGDVERPAALAGTDTDDLRGRLYGLTADQGLLAWELPDGDPHDMLLSVVELRTGRLLAEGPRADWVGLGREHLETALTPDGTTAVTSLGDGPAIAWNVTTGAELWRQEADEQSISPVALPSADVLYAAVDDLGLTALDMRTKKVLAPELDPDSTLAEDGEPLQFTTDGHGVLAAGDLFVFAGNKLDKP